MTIKQERKRTLVNVKALEQQRKIKNKVKEYRRSLGRMKAYEKNIKAEKYEAKLQKTATKQLDNYKKKVETLKKYREGTLSYEIDTSQMKRPNQKEALLKSRAKRHLTGDVKRDSKTLESELKKAYKNLDFFIKMGYDYKYKGNLVITLNGKQIKNPTADELSSLTEGQRATLMQLAKDVNRRAVEIKDYDPQKDYDVNGTTQKITVEEYAEMFDNLKRKIWEKYMMGELSSTQAQGMVDFIDRITPEQEEDLFKRWAGSSDMYSEFKKFAIEWGQEF